MYTDLGLTFKKNSKGSLVKIKVEGLSGMLCSLIVLYLALVREIVFFQVILSAIIALCLFIALLILSNHDKWVTKGKPNPKAWVDRVIELFYLFVFISYGWYGTAFMYGAYSLSLALIRKLAKNKIKRN